MFGAENLPLSGQICSRANYSYRRSGGGPIAIGGRVIRREGNARDTEVIRDSRQRVFNVLEGKAAGNGKMIRQAYVRVQNIEIEMHVDLFNVLAN